MKVIHPPGLWRDTTEEVEKQRDLPSCFERDGAVFWGLKTGCWTVGGWWVFLGEGGGTSRKNYRMKHHLFLRGGGGIPKNPEPKDSNS